MITGASVAPFPGEFPLDPTKEHDCSGLLRGSKGVSGASNSYVDPSTKGHYLSLSRLVSVGITSLS